MFDRNNLTITQHEPDLLELLLAHQDGLFYDAVIRGDADATEMHLVRLVYLETCIIGPMEHHSEYL